MYNSLVPWVRLRVGIPNKSPEHHMDTFVTNFASDIFDILIFWYLGTKIEVLNGSSTTHITYGEIRELFQIEKTVTDTRAQPRLNHVTSAHMHTYLYMNNKNI